MSQAVQNLVNLIARSTRHVVLNPIVTAALLWVLTKAPPQLHDRLTSRIALLKDPLQHARIVKALKVCLALGSAAVLNKQMNHVALNSGRLRSEKPRWNWSREVAVVTGGCSGIGELTVRRLISKGIRVAILDIRQLPPSLQGCKPSCFPFALRFAMLIDHSCKHQVLCLRYHQPKCSLLDCRANQSHAGRATILINNAGILEAHTILNTSDEYLRKIFDVNVLSNWYTVKAFLPDMVRQNKGHIITVASLASYVGVAGMSDYTATKAAILSFHEALSQELRLHYNSPNVLTTSIHPHWVRTPLLGPVEDELQKRGEPILEPAVIADAIVESVMSCSGRQVVLPTNSRAPLVRALPNWLQESVRSNVGKVIYNSAQ